MHTYTHLYTPIHTYTSEKKTNDETKEEVALGRHKLDMVREEFKARMIEAEQSKVRTIWTILSYPFIPSYTLYTPLKSLMHFLIIPYIH